MAGSVSPANSSLQEFCPPLSGWTHGQTGGWFQPRCWRVRVFGLILPPVLLLATRLSDRSTLDRSTIMQLKHANLVTPDVAASAEFFQRFFGFEIVDKRGANALAVMRDQDDFVLTLMKSKKSDPDRYPQTFHVGFYFDNPGLVKAKRAELQAAGLSPGEVETTNRGGEVSTFYCVCPGGITVEVCTAPGFVKQPASTMAG